MDIFGVKIFQPQAKEAKRQQKSMDLLARPLWGHLKGISYYSDVKQEPRNIQYMGEKAQGVLCTFKYSSSCPGMQNRNLEEQPELGMNT